jgi:hypothetical protein
LKPVLRWVGNATDAQTEILYNRISKVGALQVSTLKTVANVKTWDFRVIAFAPEISLYFSTCSLPVESPGI